MQRLLLILCLLLFAPFSFAAELRIATAANFYPTLNKIKRVYEDLTKHKVTIIRGSSGKLYAQIIHGAPYDIFFSADEKRVDALIKKNKIDASQARVYAIGQLALWRANVESSQELRQILYSGNFNKLAIANPKTAPYGRAAIQALKALELYESVKSKLVYGENISQTMQFVQSGAADIGFVARPYVIKSTYWEVDPYFHQPINQKAGILKQSKQIEVAKQFFEFMQSDAIQNIIRNDGYLLD